MITCRMLSRSTSAHDERVDANNPNLHDAEQVTLIEDEDEDEDEDEVGTAA